MPGLFSISGVISQVTSRRIYHYFLYQIIFSTIHLRKQYIQKYFQKNSPLQRYLELQPRGAYMPDSNHLPENCFFITHSRAIFCFVGLFIPVQQLFIALPST
jgi:hypothetical protein